MIHLIYIYFIVSGICFGYAIGDKFNDENILMKLLLSE